MPSGEYRPLALAYCLLDYKGILTDTGNHPRHKEPTMVEMMIDRFFWHAKSSPWGGGIYSIATGLFGTLLMAVFLSGLMPLATTLKYLPLIVGFNAAVSGYTLLDRNRKWLWHKKLAGIMTGFCVALLACISLNLLAWKMIGTGLMEAATMVLCMSIGAVFGGLGAGLAVKYHRIKHL